MIRSFNYLHPELCNPYSYLRILSFGLYSISSHHKHYNGSDMIFTTTGTYEHQCYMRYFGAGCLPTYIDMSRYGGTTYTLLLYNSRIARSRNYLHGTVSRLHIALLNIVYWIPMSSLSRGSVIRTIGICREHEEHWSYIRVSFSSVPC